MRPGLCTVNPRLKYRFIHLVKQIICINCKYQDCICRELTVQENFFDTINQILLNKYYFDLLTILSDTFDDLIMQVFPKSN
jgi:hypothetical protein